jgi:5'-nucleotidase
VRILLTNDDGIGAEGPEMLEGIALTLPDDIWIVAPGLVLSGASRALTTLRAAFSAAFETS